MLERVRELLPDLPPTVAARVEAAVRRDWGGDRPYIAKAGESLVRVRQSERDERIRADFRRGERVPFLSRRYGMSERWIRKILNS